MGELLQELEFGDCPACRQGVLLVVRDVNRGKLLLICDDCESQWASPGDTQDSGKALQQADEAKKVVPASLEEVKAAGWLN